MLAATLTQLASIGFDAMSVVAIADAAGTTRQTIYRRWPTKAVLAVAAIASLPEAAAIEPTGDHRADLLAELAAFHRGVRRPGGVSMVGSMLQDGTDPELRTRYRDRVVAPRRRRLRAILDGAQLDGLVAPEIDTSMLAASCTGTLYALVLSGEAVPRDWPARMVTALLGP